MLDVMVVIVASLMRRKGREMGRLNILILATFFKPFSKTIVSVCGGICLRIACLLL